MKLKSRLALAALLSSLWAGASGLLCAGEDCPPVTHTGDCSHSVASNPGLCWAGPNGQGVVKCESQTSEASCNAASNQAYEVKDDFPQTGPTADGTYDVADPEGGIHHCWAAHHNTKSPGEDCYTRVSCHWVVAGAAGRCEKITGSEQMWYSRAKMTTSDCVSP